MHLFCFKTHENYSGMFFWGGVEWIEGISILFNEEHSFTLRVNHRMSSFMGQSKQKGGQCQASYSMDCHYQSHPQPNENGINLLNKQANSWTIGNLQTKLKQQVYRSSKQVGQPRLCLMENKKINHNQKCLK